MTATAPMAETTAPTLINQGSTLRPTGREADCWRLCETRALRQRYP